MIGGYALFVALICSSHDEIQYDYMGRTRSMHAKEMKCVQGFGCQT